MKNYEDYLKAIIYDELDFECVYRILHQGHIRGVELSDSDKKAVRTALCRSALKDHFRSVGKQGSFRFKTILQHLCTFCGELELDKVYNQAKYVIENEYGA